MHLSADQAGNGRIVVLASIAIVCFVLLALRIMSDITAPLPYETNGRHARPAFFLPGRSHHPHQEPSAAPPSRDRLVG